MAPVFGFQIAWKGPICAGPVRFAGKGKGKKGKGKGKGKGKQEEKQWVPWSHHHWVGIKDGRSWRVASTRVPLFQTSLSFFHFGKRSERGSTWVEHPLAATEAPMTKLGRLVNDGKIQNLEVWVLGPEDVSLLFNVFKDNASVNQHWWLDFRKNHVFFWTSPSQDYLVPLWEHSCCKRWQPTDPAWNKKFTQPVCNHNFGVVLENGTRERSSQ